MGGFRALGEDHAAGVIQGTGPDRAVGSGTGEDDGHGILRVILGHRAKERVENQLRTGLGISGFGNEFAILDFKQTVGGQNEDFARSRPVTFLGHADGQRDMRGEDFGEVGFLVGRKMLDDEECRMKPVRDRLQKLLQRSEASGGTADGDEGSHCGAMRFNLIPRN